MDQNRTELQLNWTHPIHKWFSSGLHEFRTGKEAKLKNIKEHAVPKVASSIGALLVLIAIQSFKSKINEALTEIWKCFAPFRRLLSGNVGNSPSEKTKKNI